MIGLQPDSAGPSVDSPASKTPTRTEWLDTAKRRAMDLIRGGKLDEAICRFCFELPHHEVLRSEFATLGRVIDGLKAHREGKLSTAKDVAAWIHSFT